MDRTLANLTVPIAVLEASGLIGSKKIGRARTCTLKARKLAAAERWFGEQRALWESRYHNLDNLLSELSGEKK
jgi:hypothetical protein